jgi:diaminohydroxyphosphoribosylaminopyrimidine deaminase/5-amino-6-(5-phosphoribosylamino)uracil reductase
MVTSAITDEDRRHMRHALDLARRAEGQTFPNPAVGCVIIKDQQAGQVAVAGPLCCTLH